MNAIYFYIEEKWQKDCLSEAEEAMKSFRNYGFGTDLRMIPDGGELPVPDPESLYLADSDRLLQLLKEQGAAFCAYSHSANGEESLKEADYILMEPQWVDRDSLVKIWQRQRHLPWTIAETERCVVREFVPEDLEAIYGLYDEEARKYLEPPSEDREKERRILAAYIDRVYRLCGYGHWAVLSRETGGLIGRFGFSFPNAKSPGPVPDAAFGYLLHKTWRGSGIAREIGAALLEYGFSQLGFDTVGADTAAENSRSDRILRSFGFKEVAREKDQRYYILKKEDWCAAVK